MADTIAEQLGQIERQIVDARLKLAMGRLENTAQISQLRRSYARLATKARAEEIAAGEARGTRHGAVRVSKLTKQEAAPEKAEAKGGFMKGIVDRLSGSKE